MKNPFEAFQETDQDGARALRKGAGADRPRTAVKNPFEEFRGFERPDREIPLDEILVSHDSVMACLTGGYKRLVADEVGEGVWREDGDSIVRIYARAEEIAREVTWETGDVEAFCIQALQSDDPDFFLMGPLGLYLSALCNVSREPEISINLSVQELRVPLLGYRLAEGIRLTVEGDLGDLTGISMEGGRLKVVGNVGRYLGAGMEEGRIDVSGEAGRFVGEQMVGGEIHIQGRLGGVGKPQGGEIYHRKQRIYSGEDRG